MMLELIPALIVLVLILLNGFFVAAEFALIGAPRASIETKAILGDRIAKILRKILSEPRRQDHYIATAQLGITLSSLGLGMYGEHMLAAWLEDRLTFLPLPPWIAAHSIATLTAIACLTYLHIVIGEMVPKSLALQKAEKTAMFVTPIMRWFQFLFYPLVLVLNGIGNGVLRLMGVRRSEDASDLYHTPEELEFVIRESQEGGLLKRETGEVLQELLEFGDLLAREVMMPRVKIIGIPIGATNHDLVKILEQTGHTRYPLFVDDLDHIVGSIHIKDFLKTRSTGQTIQQEDARPVPYIPGSANLEKVLQAMQHQNAHMVVVMDEYGGTAGLITIDDLFGEIVGDIDEAVNGASSIRDKKDGSLIVGGLVRLEEIGERLEMDLEHEEVDTVGGLILDLLGRPAVLGDKVEYKKMRFTVTAVDGHAVSRCRIFKYAKP